ncbi:glycosyltransferase family 4 protein [Pseudoxanthomonas mexicana]|uniref:Glycosyltransferase family 4 protein n=1 Tax=Pseudoxanthomonas mexicana TaxID=128785 RepID=A0ABX6R8Y3_PSEMX|nr:glycosyltransferase family 4 protein [Pseudoxanthomonas mexicana]QLQ27384.1 MAG: glycosyltransferase family 4 protein [Pseudoxanthomonas sp.]QND79667.1 glycosyltransferase family 4 protein [Pseudoxanthomonas mexicana]
MRVALISMTPVFPAKAGHSVRILQLCKAIRALGHELTFVHVSSKLDTQKPDTASHVEFFGEQHYLHLHDGPRGARAVFWLRGKLRRRWRKILCGLGYEHSHYSRLDENWRNAWTHQLRALDRRFDAVVVEYAFNSHALDAFPASTRKLLDTHDAFADRHRPFVARGFRKGYWVSLKPQDENRGLRRADAVIAIQAQEAEHFRQQLTRDGAVERNPEIAVVSHFIGLDQPVPDHSVDHAALYVGTNMLSNQISLGQFLEHVLPRVVSAIPDFRLRLAGSICNWAPDLPNVEKLGFVDDLRLAFARAPLSVNPTIAGTGINIKLLDAMGAGVPTISTLTGARGLGAQFRNGLRVVPDHDHDAFADHVIRLSKDADLRRSLGLAAFADAQRWNEGQLAALDRCLRGDTFTDVVPSPHAPRRDRWPDPRSASAAPTAA